MLWMATTGLVILSTVFILDAMGLLTVQRAISYTTFVMGYSGLVASLFATFISYQAYLDGREGYRQLKEEVNRLTQHVKTTWASPHGGDDEPPTEPPQAIGFSTPPRETL